MKKENTNKDQSDILEIPYSYLAEYLYSYGEISRFFKEIIENKRLLASKCSICGKVWMHPRGYCSDCYTATEWVPLTGKGTVVSAAYCFFSASKEQDMPKLFDLPYVLAIIKLDGADTCMLHTVVSEKRILGSISPGTRVKVAWMEKRTGTITDFYFVPETDI